MAKVWKFPRKMSMKEFLSIKLQTYSVQTAALLLRQLITDTLWNMYRILAVLKNNILRKKSMVDQLVNKNHVVHSPQFYEKNRAHVRPSCRSAKSSDIFTGKCLWWGLFFTKGASLEFTPAISLKGTPTKRFSHMGSSRSLTKINKTSF